MERTEKNLDYYRKNAEEDYLTTPISVLRYISEMEAALRQPPVSGALPPDELDSAAERYLIPNYFIDIPTIDEEIKEFNELKEVFKAGYLLRQ